MDLILESTDVSSTKETNNYMTPLNTRSNSFLQLLNAPIKQRPSGGNMFEIAPDIPVLNKALQEIGIFVLEQYFDVIFSVTSEQVVSIGSGNGHVERHIENEFETEILCVDPNHVKNTNINLYKTSTYDNISHLLETRSDLIGNCTLFINWSTPNASTWDYEAIRDIKPNHILIVFESTGSAGSKLLHEWLNFCGVVTDKIPSKQTINSYEFVKYNVVKSTIKRKEIFPDGMFEYEILWLSKDPIVVDTSHISDHVGDLIPRKAYNPLDNLTDSLLYNIRTITKE